MPAALYVIYGHTKENHPVQNGLWEDSIAVSACTNWSFWEWHPGRCPTERVHFIKRVTWKWHIVSEALVKLTIHSYFFTLKVCAWYCMFTYWILYVAACAHCHSTDTFTKLRYFRCNLSSSMSVQAWAQGVWKRLRSVVWIPAAKALWEAVRRLSDSGEFLLVDCSDLISLCLVSFVRHCLNFSHSTLGQWIRSQKSWCAWSSSLQHAFLCHPILGNFPREKMRKCRRVASNDRNAITASIFVIADLTSCHIFRLQTTGLQKGQAIRAAQTWIRTFRRLPLVSYSHGLSMGGGSCSFQKTLCSFGCEREAANSWRRERPGSPISLPLLGTV